MTNRIDYCNSLLYGLPDIRLKKLQRVQNTVARLICNISLVRPYCAHTYFINYTVKFRIDFKVLLITYKALHGLAESLMITSPKSRYNLRSDSELLLQKPKVKSLSTFGDKSFAFAAPTLWNKLPAEIRHVKTVYKKLLKTYLFKEAFH